MAKYHFNIGDGLRKVFGNTETSPYVTKAFETAIQYVDDCNPEYRGMLILFDSAKHFSRMFKNDDITVIEGRNMKKKREEVKAFTKKKGKKVLDSHTTEFYELIGHHGEIEGGMEGAIAINLSGNYVDSGLFVEGVSTRGIQILADTGARHRAGAFASKTIVDYSLVVSEETGRVTVFRDGKTYDSMSYKPKRLEVPQEKELYSED